VIVPLRSISIPDIAPPTLRRQRIGGVELMDASIRTAARGIGAGAARSARLRD
jgi:hypothetical protein